MITRPDQQIIFIQMHQHMGVTVIVPLYCLIEIVRRRKSEISIFAKYLHYVWVLDLEGLNFQA